MGSVLGVVGNRRLSHIYNYNYIHFYLDTFKINDTLTII